MLMVRGEIDMETAAAFGAAIEQAMALGVPVVLDFAGVTFMDSSGLNVLLIAHEAGGPGSVSVQNPTPQVRRVFTITRLTEMFAVDTAVVDSAETEPEAVPDKHQMPTSAPAPLPSQRSISTRT
jgi:anti-sigma B factor antagonist